MTSNVVRPSGRTRVLFVGLQPIAAIQALVSQDVAVTVVAAANEVPKRVGLGGVRVVVAECTTTVEPVLAALARAGLGAGDFDIAAAQGEFEIVVAATLRELFGCRGMRLGQALLLRDKFLQKQAVRAAGLAVADCHVINPDFEMTGEPALPPGQWVIKPLAGAGAHDTLVLAETSLLSAFISSREPSVWLLESFVDGREHHLDGVWRGLDHLTFAMSRDLNNMITVHEGALVGSYGLRRSAHQDLYAQAHAFLVTALSALAIEDCVFHLELFVDDQGRLVFGECAGRVGGGKISDVLAHQFNMHVYDEWARLLVGSISDRATTEPGGCYGWVNLALPPGKVLRLPTTDEMLGLPGVVNVDLSAVVGEPSPDSKAGTDTRAGRVLVAAESEDEVARFLADAAEWFCSRSVVAWPDGDRAG